MAAGPEILQLLKLQRLDGRLELLRRELEMRPKMHSVKQERLADLEGKKKEIHEVERDITRRIDRIELEGKSIDEKIAENEKRLGSANTNVEYQGFQSQIARLREQRAVVDDQLLEIWDEREEAANLDKQCDKVIAEQRAIVDEESVELEKELAVIRTEAKKLLAERVTAREPIPAELLDEYDALFGRYGHQSIVRVDEGICGGCHMSLSPQIMANLKDTKPVHCNNCRRLIYIQ